MQKLEKYNFPLFQEFVLYFFSLYYVWLTFECNHIQILKSHKEAKIGFGAGNSIESSITQALYDCPFMGAGIEVLSK